MKIWYLIFLLFFGCITEIRITPKESTIVDFNKIKNNVLYPSVQVITSHGNGSGTIVGNEQLDVGLTRYFVLTAKHVIEAAAKAEISYIRIETFDFIGHGDVYTAHYYVVGEFIDAAILYFDTDKLITIANIANTDSVVYTPIYVISCHESQYPTLNTGFITADFCTYNLIRNRYTIFSNISFGSSGGGIFDANTNELTAIVSSLSGGSQNIALSYYIYALKISEVKKWLKQVRADNVLKKEKIND